MPTIDPLETQIQFLSEKRREPYLEYGDRVSQMKIEYEAKNLGGVFGSAENHSKVVD